MENLVPLPLRREFMTDAIVNTAFHHAARQNDTREAALISVVALLVADRERLQAELRRVIEALPAAPFVHILHLGSALCGKPSPPGRWSDGDRWVPLLGSDPDNPLSAATCTRCRRSAAHRGPDGNMVLEPESWVHPTQTDDARADLIAACDRVQGREPEAPSDG